VGNSRSFFKEWKKALDKIYEHEKSNAHKVPRDNEKEAEIKTFEKQQTKISARLFLRKANKKYD